MQNKREKVKIEHNFKLFLVIVLFLIVLFGGAIGFGYFSFINPDLETECLKDLDCIPAECCHANSCISVSKAPDCSNIFCTTECVPETLDCNQGSCKCINGKCSAVI
jgi:hypothetical protein